MFVSRVYALLATSAVAAAGIFQGAAAVHASGFALREQSVAAMGNAFAGATAGAEDISYLFFNPAAIALHDGTRVVNAITFVVPKFHFSDGVAASAAGTPTTGGNGGDAGENAFVPALYAAYAPAPDWRVGIGINAPFGMATDYDFGWIGRYWALNSTVKTINLNPVVSYRVTPALAVAGGLQLQYARASLSNAVDFGTLDRLSFGGAFGGVPGADDGYARLRGSDWGVGFTAGMLYQIDPATRLGAAYRSQIRHQLQGPADFNTGGPVGGAIAAATGAFTETDVRFGVVLPETASVGFRREVTPRLAVMGEAAWTRWSRMQQLVFRFANPSQADSVLDMQWEDSWFLALGASYRYRENTLLRFGIAFEEGAVPDATRTPRVPDSDRTWLSIGLQQRLGAHSVVDVSYTHIFFADAALALTGADPINRLRGNLSGSYDNSVDLFGVRLSTRF